MRTTEGRRSERKSRRRKVKGEETRTEEEKTNRVIRECERQEERRKREYIKAIDTSAKRTR